MEDCLEELQVELASLIREAEGLLWFRGPYGPNPPLSEGQLKEFEAAHGIALPAEYRRFLLKVGNGGRWPWLGQEPFGQIGTDPWHEGNGWVGSLSAPFPHKTGWNDPSGEPDYDDEREGDPEYEQQYEQREWEWRLRYFNGALLNGAIPLNDHGCGRYSWLVVTGPLAGGVWFDSRTDRQGIYPITNHDGLWVGFLDWMLLRVDAARRCVRREKARTETPSTV